MNTYPGPILFKQPISGDRRCGLYSLANLFNEQGFLLFRDVDKMTDHNLEQKALRALFELGRSKEIAGIFPVAIVPNHKRISFDWITWPQLETDGFVLGLVDYLPLPDAQHAHTCGIVWFGRNECWIVNPQKNNIQSLTKEDLFSFLHIVGVRLLHGGDDPENYYMPEFSPEEMPHLFAAVPNSAITSNG